MTNIKDLAKMAGVSVTTVSRVLNNHPYVSEEKKNAVLEAVKASNYHKNINAVHLSTGKTSLMGVVLPFSDHPYFGLLLKGIANQALEYNYKLVLFQTDYMESRELEALQMLMQKQIDSLIICSRTCDLSTIKEHLPFAYRDFVKKYNLPYKPDYIMDECYYFEDGEKVIKQIQEMDAPPSALLVTSDQVAAGIVTCCKNRHISIPDELAIIGFDNQPIAKMMNITTVEIPLENMGKNLFLQAVNGDLSNEELPAKLIERGTV
ncbi:LacI family DNA-binding transcriptional regulator [Paenibacillus durus]|uniref:LacI family transcriptional regulator n=1 Tax=Paenibacillus durus TaxID=44251 RepID=A0A089IVJ0_PAEDU|nr:LacI family DNA-binding transcriptional regulator [Paenibacillus durus]AIQ12974.1 LacI family transcriptional regulator [Paenibacillus durus]